MRKIASYISLSLIMLMMGTFTVFAASETPPSITFDFEDSSDDSPPSLSTQPSNNNTTTNTATPPIIPSPGSNETPPQITFTFDPNQAAATITTNNSSTGISKTGPETNYLIVASLILGYLANRCFKKASHEKFSDQLE